MRDTVEMAPTTTSLIVLLRGINVGGKNKLAMADLRRIASDAGFVDAVTYVQSGNLVLPSVESATIGKVGGELAAAITKSTGLEIPIITRTRDEWQGMIDTNPFPDVAVDPTKLHVVVLDGDVPAALTDFDVAPFAPEDLRWGDRVLYLSLPGGMGRSKLAVALQRVGNKKGGTARNWRTVLALADLAAR